VTRRVWGQDFEKSTLSKVLERDNAAENVTECRSAALRIGRWRATVVALTRRGTHARQERVAWETQMTRRGRG
jgi:hypothetical protein